MSVIIDWNSLGFKYMDAGAHIVHTFRNGTWDEGAIVDEPYLRIHIAATALHYGQAVFEGLKAFMGADGRVRIFRSDKNARRMSDSALRLRMAPPPVDLFVKAVERIVRHNIDFVPPYGTGGSLYIRPLLLGTGPRIGVQASDEYTFLALTLPVGPYYKGGLKPVRAVVLEDYDRAAPHGVGHVKAAGNYAASLEPHEVAARMGFQVELYLDARERRYIEEFGTSNFIGITRGGAYVSARSSSILPSITNMSLQELAAAKGIPVEVRPVAFDELEQFAEIGACGTAVVITPVHEIVRGNKTIRVGPADGCGPVLQDLYDSVTGIQYGLKPDLYGWTVVL